jgi:hypothetical protein
MYEEPVDSFQLSMGRYNLLTCENPNHEEHIENFLRKYPTAKGRVLDTIIVVDPRTWYISDIPKDNTVRCYQVCNISEDIK